MLNIYFCRLNSTLKDSVKLPCITIHFNPKSANKVGTFLKMCNKQSIIDMNN